MAEYIDRTALLENLPDEPYKGVLRRVLMQAPVADVAPVVHGQWISVKTVTHWMPLPEPPQMNRKGPEQAQEG